MNPKKTLQQIFDINGEEALYISSTGYLSRLAYQINKERSFKYTIFYMQGSMGLAPCIGLGVALCNRDVNVVVLNGDGAYLMQLGFDFLLDSYVIDDKVKVNHYVFVNNCYESTGGQFFKDSCYSMLNGVAVTNTSFINVDKIEDSVERFFKMEVPDRVEITPEENTKQVMEFLRRSEK